MPVSSHPWFDHPGPLAIAHRGGASEEPENTMRAFAAAVDAGYRWLETDVHATADGVLVAFHDAELDRVTDRRGRIRDLSWAEVSKARVAGSEPIPRMNDLLDAFGEARWSIDAKHDSAVGPLVELLRRPGTLGRVSLGAFSDRRLGRLRSALGPGACVGLGPLGLVALALRARGAPVRLPPAGLAQPPASYRGRRTVDATVVTAAHDLGLPVVVWTIDDPADMDRLLDDGVDGIITDRPQVLRQVLERRGQWFD